MGQGQATVTNPERFYVSSLGGRSVCTPNKLWLNYLPVELPAHVACLSKLLPAQHPVDAVVGRCMVYEAR